MKTDRHTDRLPKWFLVLHFAAKNCIGKDVQKQRLKFCRRLHCEGLVYGDTLLYIMLGTFSNNTEKMFLCLTTEKNFQKLDWVAQDKRQQALHFHRNNSYSYGSVVRLIRKTGSEP